MAEASQVAASEAAALAEAVQAQVGDTLSNDTQKNSERHIYAIRCFLCYPKSVIRLSHTYIHRASQFVFCKEISNLNSVIGRIITK